MKLVEVEEQDQVVDMLISMVEEQSGKSIFTLRVLEEEEETQEELQSIKVLIVFEDKNIMLGFVTIIDVDGKLGCRLQGNYI